MPPNLIIRDETPADIAAISDVTVAAFATLEISGHTEHFIVAALRAAGALTLSLVAELDGRVVGHIAFSPVVMSDDTPDWYALGPVSVLPEYQRQGIGKALVEAGLARLKALRGRGCCLVGHPDYYRRFGFRNVADLRVDGVPQKAKMGQKWGQTGKNGVRLDFPFMLRPAGRVSLSAPPLCRSAKVWFVIAGAGKREALAPGISKGDRPQFICADLLIHPGWIHICPVGPGHNPKIKARLLEARLVPECFEDSAFGGSQNGGKICDAVCAVHERDRQTVVRQHGQGLDPPRRGGDYSSGSIGFGCRLD